MKTFASSKNIYTCSFLWIFVVFMTIVPFVKKVDNNEPPIYIFYVIIAAIIVTTIWILLDTKYIIKGDLLHYYSGPFRGKINIQSIRKLENDTSFFKKIILKPSLGTDGFVVHYNKFDDIYISPKDKKAFENEILKINPNVIVIL